MFLAPFAYLIINNIYRKESERTRVFGLDQDRGMYPRHGKCCKRALTRIFLHAHNHMQYTFSKHCSGLYSYGRLFCSLRAFVVPSAICSFSHLFTHLTFGISTHYPSRSMTEPPHHSVISEVLLNVYYLYETMCVLVICRKHLDSGSQHSFVLKESRECSNFM